MQFKKGCIPAAALVALGMVSCKTIRTSDGSSSQFARPQKVDVSAEQEYKNLSPRIQKALTLVASTNIKKMSSEEASAAIRPITDLIVELDVVRSSLHGNNLRPLADNNRDELDIGQVRLIRHARGQSIDPVPTLSFDDRYKNLDSQVTEELNRRNETEIDGITQQYRRLGKLMEEAVNLASSVDRGTSQRLKIDALIKK